MADNRQKPGGLAWQLAARCGACAAIGKYHMQSKLTSAGADGVEAIDVLSALHNANSRADYNRAKQLAERLDVVEQMAMIDTFIETSNRLGLRKGARNGNR